ncbi:hypothetical protein GGS23DRAFT_556788 [Durotheca rogersii]|uniref:uncharacterized protein n=1 Tax=Durotheca rogersii TaxID=419775 RepID=UPI00221F84CE|nr:uncharacterized protein GGS23DRAFT_556788 [Durotheca rogersii]KAI5866369.1 hypothetical protein GGS23DRAFT_556788 [Durotheca rogersii]
MDLDDEDDEDEEMLQLKLQAIQAKLKLKKLQSAKAKKALGGGTAPPRSGNTPIPDIPLVGRAQSRAEPSRAEARLRSQSQPDIHVPASPVRRAPTAQNDNSPSRVRLGIDKGIKAKDVSLKRAPSFRRTESQASTHGGYLRRAHTPSLPNTEQPTRQERPLTFSERLAAARSDEASRQERRERIEQVRSKAFELGREEMEQFKSKATEIPDAPLQPEQYSREEVMAGPRIQRSNTMPSLSRSRGTSHESSSQAETSAPKKAAPSEVPEEDAAGFEPYSSVHLSKRVIPHSVLTRNLTGKKTYVLKDLLKHVKAPDFQLPEIEQDIVIFGILASKSEPRSHKPTNNAREKETHDPSRGKYMVLQLVDLQWEVELFLFNSGFDRFWKLTPGTLLAVLNPAIMPPPPGRTDTGRFSLVINSDQDTILEVGTSRDLGFCKSLKKDGEYCNSWVNRKRTEFCEFHMNTALSRHRQARQDINAFNTGLGPRSKRDNDDPFGKRRPNSYQQQDREQNANNPTKFGNGSFDRESRSQWFISKPSAASMLDNEVLGGQVASRVERSEALRRRLATEEKERELMKKLGKMGSGAGKEYMQRGGGVAATGRSGSSMTTRGAQLNDDEEQPRQDIDAKALGLVAEKGREPRMHLSPIKRKRAQSAISTSSGSGFPAGTSFSSSSSFSSHTTNSRTTKPLGWGGNLREKLGRMKDGETLRPSSSATQYQHQQPDSSAIHNTTNDSHCSSSSFTTGGGRDAADDPSSSGSGSARPPARKKTRFVTEKGIREAGRESLGTDLLLGSSTASGYGDNDNSKPGPGAGSSKKDASASARTRMRRQVVVFDDDNEEELEILGI